MTTTRVRFEKLGPELRSVEIVRDTPSPVIPRLHGALLSLGIAVFGYRARAEGGGLLEHLVLGRHDGGPVNGALSRAAQAMVLLLVGESERRSAGPLSEAG